MRNFLTFFFCLFPLFANASQSSAPEHAFAQKILALESKSGGRLGVAVITAEGQHLYRQDERFAMCSTFKALLGAAVLARVDAKLETLDRPVTFNASDILEYAPIAKEQLPTGHMTIAELNAASIQYSDNTAANLLLQSIGGPASLTKFLRLIGDKTTRLDRNEPSLNSNIAGDPRDTSTPLAMAETWQKLLMQDYLSLASKEQLKTWLFGNTTGDTRIKAGLDKSWLVGDKTGTCANGANNDVAIVFPRQAQPFIISVFYTGSTASSDQRNAVIAEVARIASESVLKNTREKPQQKLNGNLLR